MDLQLKDKVAIVTGGSKGIGEGIVRALLAEGAKIANVNRSTDEGLALQAEYEANGQECLFIQGDLTDIEACRRAVESTIEKFGRIDIVVNNAGVNDGVGLDAGPDEFAKSLQRNLIHYYAIVHFALDELKKSQGSIINIGSKVCVTRQGKTSGYAASKGAVNTMTLSLARVLAPEVRINTICPGFVGTKWQRDGQGEGYDAYVEQVEKGTLQQHACTADDIV